MSPIPAKKGPKVESTSGNRRAATERASATPKASAGADAKEEDYRPKLHVCWEHHNQVRAVFNNLKAKDSREQDIFQSIGTNGGLVVVLPNRSAALPVSEPVLDTRVSETSRVVKKDKEDNDIPTLISSRVLKSVLKENRPRLPQLRHIVRTPFYDASGRLVDLHGFDSGTGVFCDLTGFKMPDIRHNPTVADVRAAKRLLLETMMYDFPFESKDADRANALALPLEMIVREMIEGPVPMHLFRANIPRAGKSKLARALCRIVLRQNPIARGYRDKAELAKELISVLQTTPAVLFLDNIKVNIDSEALERLVTEPLAGARLLGGNNLVEFEVRNSWAMTANNPELSRDSINRAVLTSLYSPLERPESRTNFKIPKSFDVWVRENQMRLLKALFVLVNSWIVAGCPPGPRATSQFEAWQEVVGGILTHNDIPGLMANQDAFLKEYGDRHGEEEWDEMYDRWDEQIGIGKPAPARELLKLARSFGEGAMSDGGTLDLGLGAATEDSKLAMVLGQKLAEQASRPPRGGRIIRRAEKRDGLNKRELRGQWVMERVDE